MKVNEQYFFFFLMIYVELWPESRCFHTFYRSFYFLQNRVRKQIYSQNSSNSNPIRLIKGVDFLKIALLKQSKSLRMEWKFYRQVDKKQNPS